jgi:nucleoside-diphosphate-sugar epimerase
MNLFVFGLGYTALHFIRTYRSKFGEVCGTTRSRERAGMLDDAGVQAYHFDPMGYDPRIPDQLARTDCLLVSVPPSGEADPVLNRFKDAIEAASRLRWVGYLSTVGVYGDTDGNWVDEDTAPEPRTLRSRQRVSAEQQWLALGETARFAVHIFRLAGIYGPGRNALLKVADGSAKRVVKPGQIFNRIHVDDIAQVLMASIDRPSRNMIYNVSDDEPSPPQDVIAYAAELLGREPPSEIPFDQADLTPMARSFYEDNKRVRNARIKAQLGIRLRHPTYRHGLQALLKAGEGADGPNDGSAKSD